MTGPGAKHRDKCRDLFLPKKGERGKNDYVNISFYISDFRANLLYRRIA
jgi:hypothetical protein